MRSIRAIFVAPSTPDGVAGLEGRLLYRDDLAELSEAGWIGNNKGREHASAGVSGSHGRSDDGNEIGA